MSRSKFIYVTYIRTTAEKVWLAITEGSVTREYWGYENVSDWKPGSKWEHHKADRSGSLLLVGKVLESKAPNRLVITWADAEDAARPEKQSRVSFDILPMGDMVKLTVTHDELEAGGEMEHGITEGWPRVLSSMKTYLETGTPLNTWLEMELPTMQTA